MFPKLRHIALFLAAVLLPAVLCAQSIPKLKQAEEISSGVFENGLEYFFVNNNAQAGRADFALIQSGKPDVEQTRFSLRNLEHMDPDAFLARTGVPYTEDGFVSYYQNAKVFRFPDVNVKDRMTADSTMLMMLDLMQLSDGSQTIIVCGDIDRDYYRNIFRTLAMTIPKLTPAEYSTEREKESSIVRNASAPGVISLTFKMGTAARDQAGTPVPLVVELFGREFAAILTERIRRDFAQAGIPCFTVANTRTLEVHFPAEKSDYAHWLVQSILGDIRSGGVSAEEFSRAKKISLPNIIGTGLKQGKSNAFYLDRIVNAVIAGGNLASEETIRNFFSKRQISEKRELAMFTNFVSALLGEDFPQIQAYTRQKSEYPEMDKVLRTPRLHKEKISSTTVDPVTGGSLWTWSNGMKVLYKYVPGAEVFSYALAQRGDATIVEDIAAGESAFLSDLLRISRIGGIGGEEFHEMLRVEGITMEEDISMRGLRISGHAPVAQAGNVLKALLKMANDRQMDSSAVDYFIRCSRLREHSAQPSVRAVMDSLMCPDFKFRNSGSIAAMSPDFPQRADRYFSRCFDNLSDGIFIIIGGIPESEAVDLLSGHLGGFRTSDRYAVRNRAIYNLAGGKSNCTVGGEEVSVNIAATALVPVTQDNFLAFKLALEAVRRYFSKEMARFGMYSDVEGGFEIRPVERFTIYVTCRPCMADGLPEGVNTPEPAAALKIVSAEFARIAFLDISDAEIRSYRDVVLGRMAAELASTDGMMNYALLRYSEGKDLSSGYADRLNRIEKKDIRWILEELTSSGTVEYLVQ